jgi:membrane-associated phospholipid phosphatase
MTLMLFPLFPAKGALEYLWHGPIPYMPTNGLYQGEIIPALRAHTFGAINLGALRGLVCAPSFHTVCATIFIATALPMRRLRWVLVPLNAAMLLATPVEGTHYLSDMVMGFIVAMTAIGIVRALSVRFGRVGYPLPRWH